MGREDHASRDSRVAWATQIELRARINRHSIRDDVVYVTVNRVDTGKVTAIIRERVPDAPLVSPSAREARQAAANWGSIFKAPPELR
jgi:hypothetical protein